MSADESAPGGTPDLTRESAAPEQDDSAIVWQDAESVYKPAALPLSEFLSTVQLTTNHTGDFQRQSPLLVFIEQGCIQAMEAHARGDVLNEQAGIICGHAYMNATGQFYVAVTSVLAAETANSPTHFRFHDGSWEKLWSRIEDGPNLLGWYHSHPGMGVFLSSTDLRTQQLYFPAPWQIAIVLDPVSHETAVFHGAKGERLPPGNLIEFTERQPGASD
ncbi:MAG TPA: Mov34/MPN/PAD-1 family protein [Candidatus Angelobacter sp.]